MRGLLATLGFFLLTAAPSLASPPSDRPNVPPQSIEDVRFAIAWYGAACLLGASEMDLYGNTIRLEDISATSGVSVDRIRALAEARDAEHAIAVDVLRRNGEPYRDPPEPFLTILRQAQSDCQDFERSRRVLERELSANRLLISNGADATALRATLDPLPFDFERRDRLVQVIRHVEATIAAGELIADLERLLRAVTQSETLTLDDLAAIEAQYSVLPNTDAVEAMATDLLLPNPDLMTDLSDLELAELADRILSAPDGPFARYYLWALLANDVELDQIFGSSTVTTYVIGGISEDLDATVCRRVADRAAIGCFPN